MGPFGASAIEQRIFRKPRHGKKRLLSGEPCKKCIQVERAMGEFSGAAPVTTLRWMLEKLGERCVIVFGGVEDVVLSDMAVKA
jgi:hypothetical protein